MVVSTMYGRAADSSPRDARSGPAPTDAGKPAARQHPSGALEGFAAARLLRLNPRAYSSNRSGVALLLQPDAAGLAIIGQSQKWKVLMPKYLLFATALTVLASPAFAADPYAPGP